MNTFENIENLAPFNIYMRGMTYYVDGSVTELEEVEPGEWTATVCGTDEYFVEISLNGNEITDWSCDCPYDGEICKHVIATLLAVRAGKEEESKSAFSTPRRDKSKEFVDPKIIPTESSLNSNWMHSVLSLQKKELSDFVLEYALSNKAFKEALLNRFVSPNTVKAARDYRTEVKKCFEIYQSSGGSYYRRRDFCDRDWQAVLARLSTLLSEATSLIKYGDLNATIDIALQTLQSIGDQYDDELLYNDDLYVDYHCEEAADLLLEALRHPQATQKQKNEVLEELRRLAKMTPYSGYNIYNLNELVQQVNILTQTPEESLRLIDELMEERKDSGDLYKLVLQKIELLRKIDKLQKAEEVIREYLYLVPIRRMEVDKLIGDGKFDKAIEMLDEGIRLSKQTESDRYQIVKWMELKLDIYEKSGATSAIIDICRQLFIVKSGSLEYYQKLKQLIPTEKWLLFLSSMLEETSFRNNFSWGDNVLADIYVAENYYKKLFLLISSATGREQLDGLIKYAHHLKEDYSEVLIALYTNQLFDYAKHNLGRSHYEFVAHGLLCMQKLKGGAIAVKHLLGEFREKYKRRRAMMEILGSFQTADKH